MTKGGQDNGVAMSRDCAELGTSAIRDSLAYNATSDITALCMTLLNRRPLEGGTGNYNQATPAGSTSDEACQGSGVASLSFPQSFQGRLHCSV